MTATQAPAARAQRAQPPSLQRPGRDDAAVKADWGDPADAALYEDAIAIEAAAIWAEHPAGAGLDRAMFMRLYPLLRRPLHPGSIVRTTAGKGKPYESDGIRSVQVQVDRMNGVLTPMYWRKTATYESNGKRCLVRVTVIDDHGTLFAEGESWGGMDRANTEGNQYKASFTNAAKIAFAQVGPGHEVYVQAIDYDPDVLPEAAADQVTPPRTREVAAPAVQQPAAQAQNEPDPGDVIDMLLKIDDALAPKRAAAVEGMRLAGAGDGQIARELKAANSDGERGIVALVKRIEAILVTDDENGGAA